MLALGYARVGSPRQTLGYVRLGQRCDGKVNIDQSLLEWLQASEASEGEVTGYAGTNSAVHRDMMSRAWGCACGDQIVGRDLGSDNEEERTRSGTQGKRWLVG